MHSTLWNNQTVWGLGAKHYDLNVKYFPIGLYDSRQGPHMMALFEKVVEPLRSRNLLKEEHHWEYACVSITLSPLFVCSLLLNRGYSMTNCMLLLPWLSTVMDLIPLEVSPKTNPFSSNFLFSEYFTTAIEEELSHKPSKKYYPCLYLLQIRVPGGLSTYM